MRIPQLLKSYKIKFETAEPGFLKWINIQQRKAEY